MFAHRIEKLQQLLQEKNMQALLVSRDANRFYLSGFELRDSQCNESSGCVLVPAHGAAWLLTDSRYELAARQVWPEEQVRIYGKKRLETVADLARKLGITELGVEAAGLSYQDGRELGREINLLPVTDLIEHMRLFKEDAEITALSRACALNHKVYELLRPLLTVGLTEKEIAWEVEKLFRENGSDGLNFDTIVGIGPNAALPHARPGETRLTDNCSILIDMGGRFDNYCSDQTRSWWIGDRPAGFFTETLALVQEAQSRAIAAVRPGMLARDLYRVAHDFFVKHGVAEHFTHALGHGIGLETHEPPSLNPACEMELRAGMMITVEPGLYYPEWGGIRWEHMILVTEDGAKVL